VEHDVAGIFCRPPPPPTSPAPEAPAMPAIAYVHTPPVLTGAQRPPSAARPAPIPIPLSMAPPLPRPVA